MRVRRDPQGTALAAVYFRIETSPEYVEAFQAAVSLASERYLAWKSVEDARREGGRTKVAGEAVETALARCEVATENRGSVLWPMTIADRLRANVAAIGEAARIREYRLRYGGRSEQ